MDWLTGMNQIARHIEDHLPQSIDYEILARKVGCSVYEFFRVFSFITGTTVAEYIRRRRLSQAVFDIQCGSDKIIDIALKWGYESPTSFAKAFKELHGITPTAARQSGAACKLYPPISFTLITKGAGEMNFRMEKQKAFVVTGMRKNITMDDVQTMPTVWTAKVTPTMVSIDGGPPKQLTEQDIHFEDGKMFINANPSQEILNAPTTFYNLPDMRVCILPPGKYCISSPNKENSLWIACGSTLAVTASFDNGSGVAAVGFANQDYITATYSFCSSDDKISVRIGERKEAAGDSDDPNNYDTIPAANWAVFSFTTPMTPEAVSGAYARILTEWFPASNYKRNQAIPHMEKFPLDSGDTSQPWEIWIPVLSS